MDGTTGPTDLNPAAGTPDEPGSTTREPGKPAALAEATHEFSLPPASPAYGYPAPLPGSAGDARDGYPTPAVTSGKAITILILGIASLVGLGAIPAIIALCLAPSGRREIEASGGRLTGLGKIKAGVICSIVGVIFGALVFLIAIVVVVVPFLSSNDRGATGPTEPSIRSDQIRTDELAFTNAAAGVFTHDYPTVPTTAYISEARSRFSAVQAAYGTWSNDLAQYPFATEPGSPTRADAAQYTDAARAWMSVERRTMSSLERCVTPDGTEKTTNKCARAALTATSREAAIALADLMAAQKNFDH